MAHTSIKMEVPCEFINVVPVNPLISKCQIKVCYVGQSPNRNRSIITKEVATQMANTLPGSPIVGFYNEETGDFEEHNREIYFEDGKIKLKDTTRPYGFVDLGAKCWFQKFLDDGVEHEYLMTEGYLWTGQYPESKRVIEKGNNHSMELDEDLTKAFWTKPDKTQGKFFIINESVFSKLCILGEKYEPCFEGSSITKFAFEDDFYEKMQSMITEMTKYISKGGETMQEVDEVLEVADSVTAEVEALAAIEEDVNFKKKDKDDEKDKEEKTEDKKEDNSDDSDKSTESESDKKDSSEEEDEDEKKKDKKAKYVLDEIPEYMELQTNYSALVSERDSLNEKIDTLNAQIASLTEFKNQAERKDKEAMINSFYMLSDAEKKDVVENIDKYSLDDIEAKLSIICVRNKVNFNLDTEDSEADAPYTYNLDETNTDSAIPAWVKAVMETSKELN